MDDLIRRQDAIDALWKALYDYENKTEKQFLESEELNADDWFSHRIFVQNMSDVDRQTIIDLPSAQQWIPCSERLPEELLCDDGYVEPSNPVLICFSNGAVLISRYWGNRRSKIDRPVDYLNWIDQPSWRQDPTAWMPLPEAYKESEDEE